jgi:hypothetical protein
MSFITSIEFCIANGKGPIFRQANWK